MTSWYSNILTRTSSQISSLRSTLLSTDQDGDTDDDTHVCRVLRNYYADKGRPFPHWLPAGPKAVGGGTTPQPLYVHPQAGPAGPANPASAAGGLSSLWDSAPVPQQQQQQQQQPQSLRARGSRGGLATKRDDAVGGRPPGGLASAGGGGPSAQDRLKQRLWGGGAGAGAGAGGRLSPLQPGSSPFQVPPSAGGAAEPSSGDRGGAEGRPARRQGLPAGPRPYR